MVRACEGAGLWAIVAAAGAVAGSGATAFGQAGSMVVDVDLGFVLPGQALTLTGVQPGVTSGVASAYLPLRDPPEIRTFTSDEVVYRFTVPEGSANVRMRVDVSSSSASGSLFAVLLDGLAVEPRALDAGTLPTAVRALDFTAGPGQFIGQYAPGTYFLAVDAFTGPGVVIDPVTGQSFPLAPVPFLASGSFSITLLVSGNPIPCDTGLAPAVDTNLGARGVGATRLTGATDTAVNRICAYTDVNGANLGFLADGPERVFRYTTTAELEHRIELVLPFGEVEPLVNHDYYLLDTLATITGVDIFGDGATVGRVATAGLAVLDEAGSFGVFPPGEYFLVVESFQDLLQNGQPGPFSIDLILGMEETCGSPTGPTVDFADPIPFTDGEFFRFVGSTNSPSTPDRVCEYRGVDGFPIDDFPFQYAFGDAFFQFTIVDPMRIEIEDFFFTSFPDHDYFILGGLDFVAGAPLGLGGRGTVATQTLAFLDLSGSFDRAFPPGTYIFAVDGLDGAGQFDVQLAFTGADGVVFDPDDPLVIDLGVIGSELDGPLDISLCGGTLASVGTSIGVWNQAGELVATAQGSCGIIGGPSRLEGLELDPGVYTLAIAAGGSIIDKGFFVELPAGAGAISGSFIAGNAGPVPFSAPAGGRDLFRFEVLPDTRCNPADISDTPPGSSIFGQLDGNDISTFVSGFLNGAGVADLSDTPPGSGTFGQFDGNDISAFVSAFIAGCPTP